MPRKITAVLFVLMIASISLHAEDNAQQFEGFNLAGYTEEGEKSWDIRGDTADMLGHMVKLTNIVANAYGDEQMNLTAKNGTIDQSTGHMHLEKNVVITTETGIRLNTESLDWKREEDLVTTNDKVTIQNDKIKADGIGVIAHPGLKTAQLNEDIKVKVQTDKDKDKGSPLEITCDGPMQVDQVKQMVVFENNVIAKQQGRTLKADRMEVYFDEKNNQIKQLICKGNVEIIQGENTTYAQEATYTAADQRLVLSGRPKLILMTEGENSLGSFRN